VSLQDLKQPQAQLVQKLYFFFLQEFGFSESLLLVPFDICDDLENSDIYRDMIPVLNLLAACNYFFQRFDCDGFGIKDLVAPNPKRTQKYLSVLQNFYYFCESQSERVNEVTEKVNSLVAQKKDLDQKIEEFKTKINDKKMKALEDREEEEDLQRMINEVNEDLENNLLPQREAITEESAGVKKQLADVTARVTVLKENVARVEAEKDRLQGRLDGAAVIEKLTKDLHDVQEELSEKEKRKRECRRNLELLETMKQDYATLLELAQKIAEEHQKCKELAGKIRSHATAREGLKLQLDDYEAVIREHDQQLVDLAQQVGKMKLQWGRRKRGKEEELAALTSDLEEARRKMGDEEMAGAELLTKIQNTETEIKEEEDGMHGEMLHVQAEYARLLESIEKFNENLNKDFARLDTAKNKIKDATEEAKTLASKGPAAL